MFSEDGNSSCRVVINHHQHASTIQHASEASSASSATVKSLSVLIVVWKNQCQLEHSASHMSVLWMTRCNIASLIFH
ncbi:uncharacterized protein OCT59_025465 [Rhizophagus irregularis]|uniref:uncharacterized protein n=1 Tax=Rhizophagus irregularis TaxID=588596 RepID=UPI003332D99B|nr:hypothetical protein OCT59_025465 [Rhizophagus irregularis]